MLQVTPALFPSFVTVLKRSRVSPGTTVAEVGDTETEIDVGAITVMAPTPLFVGSATEVATSWTLGLCEAKVDGVVYVTPRSDVADRVPHDVP
jgi:hypothetical protein